MTRPALSQLLATLVVIALAGCGPAAPATTPAAPTPALGPTSTPLATPGPTATAQPPTASPTVTPGPSPSPRPSPSPTASPAPTTVAGAPGPTCIHGWVDPPEGDPKREEGLQILTGYMGLTEPLVVDEMRYFVGPDPWWIIEPRFEAVEHWYIKATLSTAPSYRGRWLVERRDEDRLGVAAVAPYDTSGYESPDWHGFIGDGQPRQVEGLPGLWGGIDYDFVTGEGDGGYPGLADELAGCLDGT